MLHSAKSQDSSQAICPIYIHICPPITKANRNKGTYTCTRKKPVQEFHSFNFVTLYGRKMNYYVESGDNDIEKLILNAAPESILHKKVNTIF